MLGRIVVSRRVLWRRRTREDTPVHELASMKSRGISSCPARRSDPRREDGPREELVAGPRAVERRVRERRLRGHVLVERAEQDHGPRGVEDLRGRRGVASTRAPRARARRNERPPAPRDARSSSRRPKRADDGRGRTAFRSRARVALVPRGRRPRRPSTPRTRRRSSCPTSGSATRTRT